MREPNQIQILTLGEERVRVKVRLSSLRFASVVKLTLRRRVGLRVRFNVSNAPVPGLRLG